MTRRKNIADVISLYLVALVNLVVPLVFMPYISNVVGLDRFGKFAVFASFTQYLMILIDFGSTTPLVNHLVKAEGLAKKSALLCTTIIFRLILVFVVAIISILALYYFEISVSLYLTILLILLGVALNPYSLFQVNSLLPLFACINVFWRIIFTLWIFLSLNKDTSAAKILLFQFVPITFSSISALIYLNRKRLWKLNFSSVNIKDNKLFLSESISFLTGSFFSSGYTIALPVIIQAFFGSTATGVYGLIDRMTQPLKQIFNPLLNVIYPKVCVAFSASFDKGMRTALNGGLLIAAASVCCLVVGVFGSGYISKLLFGVETYALYIRLISCNMFFVYLSQVAVVFFVTPLGLSRLLKFVYFSLFVVFVGCCSISVYMTKLTAIYWTLVIVEALGFLVFFIMIYNKRRSHGMLHSSL